MRTRITLAVCALALASLPGCSQIGQGIDQDIGTVHQVNASPTTLTQIDESGTWSVNAAGPVRQTTLNAKGELSTIGGGVAAREVILPLEGMPALVRSDSDVALKIAELFSATTGKTVARGVELTTNTSSPTLAGVEAFAALRDYWKQRDEATRDRDIRAIEAAEEISKSLRDALIRALTGV